VVLKVRHGRELDASVELASRGPTEWELTLHSLSGHGRNSDYFQALEVLLERMVQVEAVITEISVVSSVALKLPPPDRRLAIPLPIRLNPATDISALRRHITEAQRPVARRPGAKGPGGANHKRIAIVYTAMSELALSDMEECLSEGGGPAAAGTTGDFWVAYRRAGRAKGTPVPRTLLFDSDKIDRGSDAHRVTQDKLACHLSAHGITPMSPTTGGPAECDISWQLDGVTIIGEVKSITDANETQQIRLGLGQLIDYRVGLRPRSGAVELVLILERQPARLEHWRSVCDSVGVHLTYPPDWSELPGLNKVPASPLGGVDSLG
jgi:hypothetical protein